MKGLLLKDLYMLRAYCKSFVLILVVFLVASFFGGNTFFIYYPCLLCGMLPINLLAYDEKSRFMQYCVFLPVSKAQTVSEKYLVGLLSQIAVLLVTGTVQGIRMGANGTFAPDEFGIVLLSLFIVSLLASSIPLPLIFRNGVEKGRFAYYVMIGIVCASGFLFSRLFRDSLWSRIPSGLIFGGLTVVGIGLYALSWSLSVRFYRKREL